MNSQTKPFFFDGAKASLYGVHHTPMSRRVAHGVLIVPPIGQESVRCHKSLQKVASALADLGYDVLRFDFTATGDSHDLPDFDLTCWEHDIQCAARELKAKGSVDSISLVGVRLGASLAMSTDIAFECAVVWDPIISGAAYLKELTALHEKLCSSPLYFRSPPRIKDLSPSELVGHVMPPALRRTLAEYDLRSQLRLQADKCVWIETETSASGSGAKEIADSLNCSVDLEQPKLQCHWRRVENLEDMLMAQPAARIILKTLKQRANDRRGG